MANAGGLDFISLTWERFDVVMRQRDYFREQLQTFLKFLSSPAMAQRAREFGGYDLADAGQIRFAP